MMDRPDHPVIALALFTQSNVVAPLSAKFAWDVSKSRFAYTEEAPISDIATSILHKKRLIRILLCIFYRNFLTILKSDYCKFE